MATLSDEIATFIRQHGVTACPAAACGALTSAVVDGAALARGRVELEIDEILRADPRFDRTPDGWGLAEWGHGDDPDGA